MSKLGDRIYAVALPFQLLALGASPLELGLAATIVGATYVLLLLVGGAVADRVPRRRLILASDFAAGCAVAVLALLSWTDQLQIAHLYIASGVFGAAEAFLDPAYTALVPQLVPKEILQSGSAARSLSSSFARVAGPAIGGVVVATSGPAIGFGIDALTFFVSFATLLLVRPPRHEPTLPASFVTRVREGLTFTLSLPWLLAGALGYALLNLAWAGQASVIIPLLVRDVLREDAATFGAIQAAFGVGAVVGGFALAQITIARAGVAIYVFELLAAIALGAMGIVPLVPVILALMVAVGVTLTGSDIVWQAALQRHIPREMLGRASSITLLGTELAGPFAPLIGAMLVQTIGPAPALSAAGAFAAAVATLLLFASPLRHVR